MRAPPTSSTPNTASGASRKSTPAAIGGTAALLQTLYAGKATVLPSWRGQRRSRPPSRSWRCRPPRRPRSAVPSERTLSSGWEMRLQPAAPALPQPAPPEETAPEGEGASVPPSPAGRAAQAPGPWRATHVPSVFDTRALPSLFRGDGAPLPGHVPGPAHTQGLQLADPLRERAPERRRVPEREADRPELRPLHAVHGAGARAASGPAEHAGGDRRRPQEPRHTRGLVELERDHPPCGAGARRAGAHPGPRHDVEGALQGAGAPVQGRPAPRRDAPAARRAHDQAVARGAAARARRAHHRAHLPPSGPAREEPAHAAHDAGSGPAAVVPRQAAPLLRELHAPRRRPRRTARAAAGSACARSR